MASLLALRGHELFVVLDALNAFATQCEDENDVANAAICDDIAKRVRVLGNLACADADQMMRAIGLGRYRDRPQG